jgi:hypothetical protein
VLLHMRCGRQSGCTRVACRVCSESAEDVLLIMNQTHFVCGSAS